MSMDGTGMTPPPSGAAAGAVTSREATRKNPKQGLKTEIKGSNGEDID
jgi:hypothetical protein